MLEHLTKETFKEKVFNWEVNKEWKYEGTKPCMIDFYADWCGPCKMVAPILEELQKEYGENLVIYKNNRNWLVCLAFKVFLRYCSYLRKDNLKWRWERFRNRHLKKQLLMY